MERESRWFYSVWSVLLALFVVLGPFGLPLLWKSPRFSQGMKVLLTAATVVYTALLIRETLRAGRLVAAMFDAEGLP